MKCERWLNMGQIDGGYGRYRIVSPKNFLRKAEALLDEPGIYGILFRGAEPVLVASGYSGDEPFKIGDYVHLYSGASFELGKRVPHHLVGTPRQSNLRATLHAIDAFHDGIVRSLIGADDLSDGALTDWMKGNALVAFRQCTDPRAAEKALLSETASPFNIDERKSDTYARRLIALRCALNRNPIPRWCWDAAADVLTPYLVEGENDK